MDGLFELASIVALFVAAIWVIHRYFRRFEGYLDPDKLGVVVDDANTLDDHGPPCGSYWGVPISEWVAYHGRRYWFIGVAMPRYKLRLLSEELYMNPGLLYRREP